MYDIYLTQRQTTEFLTEVYNMRKLQKEYFKTRNFKVLSDSKKHEAHIDSLIQNFLFLASENKDKNLFSELEPDFPSDELHCNCNPEYTTGQTKCWLCNNCGKIVKGQGF